MAVWMAKCITIVCLFALATLAYHFHDGNDPFVIAFLLSMAVIAFIHEPD